ncbi:amylo-alpha-1,6-glucosidase [bacterium]|nr:amylo-alpha-1,6-glucosidase [bacterium]
MTKREWLEPNGSGGFACGTEHGEIQRFWHGLLWVARKPPTARVRLVAGLEEYALGDDDKRIALTDTLQGTEWSDPELEATFYAHPFATWTWPLPGGGTLVKRVFMPRFSDAVVVQYELDGEVHGSKSQTLELRPILGHDPGVKKWPKAGKLGSIDGTTLKVVSASQLIAGDAQTEGPFAVVHAIEADCEENAVGDLWKAPSFRFTVEPDMPTWIVFTSKKPDFEPAEAFHQERSRRAQLEIPGLSGSDLLTASQRNSLAKAADDCVVRRHDGRYTILAGYPWFTDWGRDTMISLTGLCLLPYRFEDARSIISHFLDHANKGIIPNLFPEEGGDEPQFNTIDGTLWLFEAAFRYARATGDWYFIKDNLDKLADIIRWHREGTHFGIKVDRDGLLRGGDPGSQLTWMDVKVNGEVPTPRHGKPVEIQGLWYNALTLLADAEFELGIGGETVAEWRVMAERCRSAFASRFLIDGADHLADVVDRDGPGTRDETIRPNMIIPFGLTNNIIPSYHRANVLRAAAHKLLTPRGLRTLDPDHPNYHGIYCGDRLARDRAYHQGTAWMWLLAPYLAGVHSEGDRVRELRSAVPGLIRELLEHFHNEGCMESCSEIFDADAPHKPRGCFAQAWSVAALVEVLTHDWKR